MPQVKPQPVTDQQLENAAVIWNTQSKHRALSWLAGQARQGRAYPLQAHRIISRGNQLLTLSGGARFDLLAELKKFADDVAEL